MNRFYLLAGVCGLFGIGGVLRVMEVTLFEGVTEETAPAFAMAVLFLIGAGASLKKARTIK